MQTFLSKDLSWANPDPFRQNLIARPHGFAVLRVSCNHPTKSWRRNGHNGSAHLILLQSYVMNIEFRDCYVYGKSVSNQRAEAWWAQLTKTSIGKWIKYLHSFGYTRTVRGGYQSRSSCPSGCLLSNDSDRNY